MARELPWWRAYVYALWRLLHSWLPLLLRLLLLHLQLRLL